MGEKTYDLLTSHLDTNLGFYSSDAGAINTCQQFSLSLLYILLMRACIIWPYGARVSETAQTKSLHRISTELAYLLNLTFTSFERLATVIRFFIVQMFCSKSNANSTFTFIYWMERLNSIERLRNKIKFFKG